MTPLTDERFRITDTQEHRVIIELQESGDARPLQREQFERLYENLQKTDGAFDLDRLPPDAEPLAAVLMLHPRFEIDEREGILRETDGPTSTQRVDAEQDMAADSDPERTAPEYRDA